MERFKLIDMTGQKFGRLTVISRGANAKNGSASWNCECDCGNIHNNVVGTNLSRGQITSCGCFAREVAAHRLTVHGKRFTPEYNSWKAMRKRCSNPNDIAYKYYGGRGIKVCAQWQNSFSEFIADMGPRPTLKHSIDRIDNNGNYEPGNCRWATRKDQRANQRPAERRANERNQCQQK